VQPVILDTDVASLLHRRAPIWGRLSAETSLRGRPRPVNDMWIAACCLAYEVPLATLNLKDYEDFAEHQGLSILGTQ
jgi:predicted nucleic acid-binding protein